MKIQMKRQKSEWMGNTGSTEGNKCRRKRRQDKTGKDKTTLN